MSHKLPTSWAYQFFTESYSAAAAAGRQFKCNVSVESVGSGAAAAAGVCGSTIAFSSITSLKQHLERVHRAVYDAHNDAVTAVSVGSKRKNPITELFNRGGSGVASASASAAAAAASAMDLDTASVDMTYDIAESASAFGFSSPSQESACRLRVCLGCVDLHLLRSLSFTDAREDALLYRFSAGSDELHRDDACDEWIPSECGGESVRQTSVQSSGDDWI